jgi:hypothetical protein
MTTSYSQTWRQFIFTPHHHPPVGKQSLHAQILSSENNSNNVASWMFSANTFLKLILPEIPASKGRQRRKEKWKPWTLFSLCLLVSAADCLGNFLIFLVTFCIKATEQSELANTLKKQAFMSKK